MIVFSHKRRCKKCLHKCFYTKIIHIYVLICMYVCTYKPTMFINKHLKLPSLTVISESFPEKKKFVSVILTLGA